MSTVGATVGDQERLDMPILSAEIKTSDWFHHTSHQPSNGGLLTGHWPSPRRQIMDKIEGFLLGGEAKIKFIPPYPRLGHGSKKSGGNSTTYVGGTRDKQRMREVGGGSHWSVGFVLCSSPSLLFNVSSFREWLCGIIHLSCREMQLLVCVMDRGHPYQKEDATFSSD